MNFGRLKGNNFQYGIKKMDKKYILNIEFVRFGK